MACGDFVPEDLTITVSGVSQTASNVAASATFGMVTTGGSLGGGGGGFGGMSGSTVVGGSFAPMTAVNPLDTTGWNTLLPACSTAGHTLDPETLVDACEGITGYCKYCSQIIHLDRIPGGFSYRQAGILVGDAMTLDEDDDVSELLGSLKTLDTSIEKELEKLRRAKQLIELSRSIVMKKALTHVSAADG